LDGGRTEKKEAWMIFNWLDIVLLIIIGVALVFGLIKGLMRQVIGICAVIVGLILALLYYPYVAFLFGRLISSQVVSHFLGFISIFLAVLCLGGILSWLVSKMIKGPLKFMNHILGGGLGLIKGILICGVFVFALLVFPVSIRALENSFIAPYCLKMTKAIVGLIPKELKENFKDAYEDIVGKRGKNAERV
jgi:membrane protein required for colicin V production